MRAAASRTFWTAGSRSPIKMAMMAMTTSNSISVKPHTRRGRRTMRRLLKEKNWDEEHPLFGFGRVILALWTGRTVAVKKKERRRGRDWRQPAWASTD